MLKKYTQIFSKISLLALISLIFSCEQNRIDYARSEQKEIKEIDAKSHEYCISLGLDFGDEDPIKTEIFWRCKIIIANYKLTNDDTNPEGIRHNAMIRRYIKDLTTKFEYSYEKLNDYRNDFLNENHHKICERKGYKIDSLEQDKVEKYMACRRGLIRTYQINPPYKKTQYLDRPKDSYNIGFVINKRQDAELKKFNEAKEKYPFCIKLGIKTEEYKNCVDDFDSLKTCYDEAKKARFIKENEERIICQKKLYTRLPDSLMKRDKVQEDIDRRERAADTYNRNDFRSIGIGPGDMKFFYGSNKFEEKKEEIKKEKGINNTEDKLYTRAEFTRLRQKFIAACNERIDPLLEKLQDGLNKECGTKTLKWE